MRCIEFRAKNREQLDQVKFDMNRNAKEFTQLSADIQGANTCMDMADQEMSA